MYRPICRICQRKLSLSRSLTIRDDRRFCKEHLQVYKMRQRNGVITSNLDAQWVDTLDNWRERPSELDHEIGRKPFSTQLFFQQRYKNWLIFMRHYTAKNGHKTILGVILSETYKSIFRIKGHKIVFKSGKKYKAQHTFPFRLGDALVVNTETGEIRRLVDVSEDVVLDDLQGTRPALFQADIAPLWGNSEPTGAQENFEKQYYENNDRVLIPELVRLASFPVYGFVENALELSVCSIGIGGNVWNGIEDISFSFSSPHYPQKRDIFMLNSSKPQGRGQLYIQEQDMEDLFRQYSYEKWGQYMPEERARFGDTTSWEGEIVSGNTTFSGTIRYWTEPEQISLFCLISEKFILTGQAFGLTHADVLELLKTAQPINTQDTILAQYQHEMDAEHQRLRAQYSQEQP